MKKLVFALAVFSLSFGEGWGEAATQCPFAGGKAVYEARSILQMIGDMTTCCCIARDTVYSTDRNPTPPVGLRAFRPKPTCP